VNVDLRAIAEGAYAALNAKDFEAFLAMIDEDVEFTSMVAEAEGTTFHGHDGVRAWWNTVLGSFDESHWQLLEFRGSHDTAIMKVRMTGTLAGVEVAQTMWQVARARDGNLLGWTFFRGEEEAELVAGF